MKKLILIFACLGITAVSFGQFTFGPKVGFSTSRLTTDLPDIKAKVRANFQLGVFARFGEKIYLQPEIFYASRGGTFKHESNDGDQKIKFNNLDIPLLVGFRIINLEVVSLRVFVGPTASFVLNKDMEVEDVVDDPIPEDAFRNVQWGIDVGGGVDLLFLTLDLRYEWGLNNLYKADAESNYIKNSLFIVSLGFKLM